MIIELDDRKLELSEPSNGFTIARGFFKDIEDFVAMKVDGKMEDLSAIVDKDSNIKFIDKNSSEGLQIIRHSTAHILAAAVKNIYGDAVQVTIGPAIEDGFYYDFAKEEPFSEKDLENIEKVMRDIIKKDEKFSFEVWNKSNAMAFFEDKKEKYKKQIIMEIPEDEELRIYKVGDFFDLCRGPHVPSTRYLKNFKLTKVAGAYWKGDSKNEMLQRIYGVAFNTKEELDSYFKMIEEAEKRDHRKIGAEMDLYHFEPEYAPGAVFMHPKGLYVFNKLISHMREKQEAEGYIEVSTPRVMNRVLWETSGHWEKYGEHNYSGKMEDGTVFCIKPMNCPGGILVYKQGIKSYRDLPIRMAEFGKVNRYEASGALHGLLRVREFTQDDAHIFCTADQLEAESVKVIKFILDIYKDFGFENVKIKLSTRPEQRIGSERIWDISEKALADALEKNGFEYTLNPGEGAFYGPKLEFVLKDAIGRDWQCGTLQLDMNLPERFDISYIGEDGKKHQPIMLHRALLGSIERFMGILIEECEGKFPLWLNPLQIVVASISEDSSDYATQVYQKLKALGFKVALDISSEKIGYKIREHSLKKVPYIFTVGKKEQETDSVSVRTIGSEKQEVILLNDIIKTLKEKIDKKENTI